MQLFAKFKKFCEGGSEPPQIFEIGIVLGADTNYTTFS